MGKEGLLEESRAGGVMAEPPSFQPSPLFQRKQKGFPKAVSWMHATLLDFDIGRRSSTICRIWAGFFVPSNIGGIELPEVSPVSL